MSSSGYKVILNKIETAICDFNFLADEEGNTLSFASIPPHSYNVQSINDIDLLVTTDDPVCQYFDKAGYSASLKVLQDPSSILNQAGQADSFSATFFQSQYRAEIKKVTI